MKEKLIDISMVITHLTVLPILLAILLNGFNGWWGIGWVLFALTVYALKRKESNRYYRRWRYAVTIAIVIPVGLLTVLAFIQILGALLFAAA